MIKLKLIMLLFILIPILAFSQLSNIIEEKTVSVILFLSNDKITPTEKLKELKDVLNSDVDKNTMEEIYFTTKTNYDNLKNHFTQFENELKNINSDSALVLFNQWYLHLSNTFYYYNKERFFTSDRDKILFLSASVSCYCTLEMCKNQTIEILNLAREKNLDYWIVDSFEHNELQIRYETFFTPSVILFDSLNNMIYKIEYDEQMIDKINHFYNEQSKNKG